MNHQRKMLPTDRNPGLYAVLGCLFTCIPGLLVYHPFNQIIKNTGIKKINFFTAFIFPFNVIICKRMNQELERRGLEYRINKVFTSGIASMLFVLFLIIPAIPMFWQMTLALNHLSADYNAHG